MKRGEFIRLMACGSATLLPLTSAMSGDTESVTILHTNDTHSRIDPFPAGHKKYPDKGGVSRRKALVDAIRAEEENVLLLDAGDIFQGTPYFNLYGGELELKLMSSMQYDAATMGNHDFDAGLEQFSRVLPNADFPFLCANYDFSNTPIAGKTKPYHVFQKGGLKIGVFGVGIELNGLVPSALYGDTVYQNPIEKAQYYATLLKEDLKCNLVICLSHLGYFPRLNDMCDKVLAEQTSGIDLIIGGHTHTFFTEPEMRENKLGKSVLINQVGFAGLVLGRIDFFFGKKGQADRWAANPISTHYDIT